MKKFICLLMCIPLLSLCSCRIHQTPDYSWEVTDGITISLAQPEYPIHVDKMTVTLINNSDSFVYHGIGYYFEKHTLMGWVRLEQKEYMAFDSLAYHLPRHDHKTIIVKTEILKEGLDTGLYRLIGDSITVTDTEDDTKDDSAYRAYILEFKVSSDANNEPEFQ